MPKSKASRLRRPATRPRSSQTLPSGTTIPPGAGKRNALPPVVGFPRKGPRSIFKHARTVCALDTGGQPILIGLVMPKCATTISLDVRMREQLEDARARLTRGQIRPSMADVVREAIARGLPLLVKEAESVAHEAVPVAP